MNSIDNLICPICLHRIENNKCTLDCGDSLCPDCFRDLILNTNICPSPYCRKEFYSANLEGDERTQYILNEEDYMVINQKRKDSLCQGLND